MSSSKPATKRRTAAAAAAREEKSAEPPVDLTFSPPSVGPILGRSEAAEAFMNSPTVRAKIAAASQVRPTATTQVPAAPRPVSQQPRPGFQSESQFLTVTSSGTPLDAGGKPEEPIVDTSVQAAPEAGSNAMPTVTTLAESQTVTDACKAWA